MLAYITLYNVKMGRVTFHVVSLCLASGYASQHILSHWIVAGRVSGVKNTLGCMADLTLTLICVAAAALLVVTQ